MEKISTWSNNFKCYILLFIYLLWLSCLLVPLKWRQFYMSRHNSLNIAVSLWTLVGRFHDFEASVFCLFMLCLVTVMKFILSSSCSSLNTTIYNVLYLQPPNISSFINVVTSAPLESIEEPLKSFVWEFDKVCSSCFLSCNIILKACKIF